MRGAGKLLGDGAPDRRGAPALFSSEEIMMVNFECARACYTLGNASRMETWHNDSEPECRNIHFTPLVHSLYALHLRRWLKTFPASSLLLLRFDEMVARPVQLLETVTDFLALPRFPAGFHIEVGRANYTTLDRLLRTGAVTPRSLGALQTFFEPHNEALREMFGRAFW